MKSKYRVLAACAAISGAVLANNISISPAHAATVTFNFSGVSNTGDTATGSFSIDGSLLNGSSFQLLSNSNITSLSFTANSPIGPLVFSTADVDSSSKEFYNSSVAPFIAVVGSGSLAIHGALALLDGGNGVTVVGTINGADFFESYFGNHWTASVVATPLPAALPLFATGLGALGLLGWRRKRKASAIAIDAHT